MWTFYPERGSPTSDRSSFVFSLPTELLSAETACSENVRFVYGLLVQNNENELTLP